MNSPTDMHTCKEGVFTPKQLPCLCRPLPPPQGIIFGVPGAFTPGCSKVRAALLATVPVLPAIFVALGCAGSLRAACVLVHAPMQTHLPGYVADHDKIQAAGADVVVCLATNGEAGRGWMRL